MNFKIVATILLIYTVQANRCREYQWWTKEKETVTDEDCCTLKNSSRCSDDFQVAITDEVCGQHQGLTLYKYSCNPIPEYMVVVPKDHNPSKCVTNGTLDKECCAMKGTAKCKDNHHIHWAEDCWQGIAFKYYCTPNPIYKNHLYTEEQRGTMARTLVTLILLSGFGVVLILLCKAKVQVKSNQYMDRIKLYKNDEMYELKEKIESCKKQYEIYEEQLSIIKGSNDLQQTNLTIKRSKKSQEMRLKQTQKAKYYTTEQELRQKMEQLQQEQKEHEQKLRQIEKNHQKYIIEATYRNQGVAVTEIQKEKKDQDDIEKSRKNSTQKKLLDTQNKFLQTQQQISTYQNGRHKLTLKSHGEKAIIVNKDRKYNYEGLEMDYFLLGERDESEEVILERNQNGLNIKLASLNDSALFTNQDKYIDGNEVLGYQQKYQGKMFIVNPDRTVTPTHCPNLCLGYRTDKLILVNREKPRLGQQDHRLFFDDLPPTIEPKKIMPMILISHPGKAVVLKNEVQQHPSGFEEQLTLGPVEDCVYIFADEDNHIHNAEKHFQTFDGYDHKNRDMFFFTKYAEHDHQKYEAQEDGTILFLADQNYVLGTDDTQTRVMHVEKDDINKFIFRDIRKLL